MDRISSSPDAPSTEDRAAFDIAVILDTGAWHPRQKRILVLVALVAMVDGVDAQVVSLALPMISGAWGVPRAAFGIVMALSFVAMAAGTALGGVAGDRIGRKTALVCATCAFGAFTLAGAYCHDLLTLGITRGFAALGLGAAMPNAATLVSEFTPLRQRSMALGLAMSGLPIGGVVLGLLAAYILPTFGWETLFLVAGTMPLIVAALLVALLPESLRFLIRDPARAADIHRIASSMHAVPIAATHFVDSAEPEVRQRMSVRDLLSGPYGRDTILIAIAFFAVVFATYLVFTWAPSLLTDAGYSPAFIGSGMSSFSAGGLVGGIAGAKLVERLGSRPALTGMGLFGVACAVLMAMLVRSGGDYAAQWMLAGLFAAGLAIPGTGAAIYVLAGQIYPSAVRATGVGAAAGFGRLGAVTSAFFGPFLLFGGGRPFFLATGATMLIVAVALYAVRHRVAPQTR